MVSYHFCQAKNAVFLKVHVIKQIMPRISKIKLVPLNLGNESLGQRLARLRKGKGYTQAELSAKIGIIRELISDYERDKIRPYSEMIIRLAMALEITTDELLGFKQSPKGNDDKPSLKILRRVKKMEDLPESQQKVLLKTIDTFLKAAQK